MSQAIIQDKQAILRQREGDRLTRYLRVLFGNQRFGFQWTNQQTSYTDGEVIYVIYDVQRPECRPFSPAEQRILRKGHGIHERGHIQYDVLEDYRNWQTNWSSRDRDEWMANEKYPLSWLQFFGNVMMDGRMEHFTSLDHPSTKEYIDFCNYEWTFGIRGEGAGENPITDFRECFMARVLDMTDLDAWLPEPVELVDSIQELIDQGKIDESTETVLDTTTAMMKSVWPTLLEWMDLQNERPNDFDFNDHHSMSEWGNKQDVEENVKRVLAILARAVAEKGESSNPASSAKTEDREEEHKPLSPDFSNIMRMEENQLKKDEEAAAQQLRPYQIRNEEVTIHEHREDRKAYSDQLTITPFDHSNIETYNRIKLKIKPYISPTAKVLSGLLEGSPDAVRRNQRMGRVMVNRAWRVDRLGDTNVFERRAKGTPNRNARLLLLNDCSGSTGSAFPGTTHRIIDEMKKAQILMIEACEKANLPVASYGFTENYHGDGNIIFPFKPYGQLTPIEKGFIGGIDDRWGNRDTISLQWAVNELANYTENVRVLVMLSDGEPCFAENEDYDTMRSIVLQAEKRCIEVLCLYVGPQEARVLDRVRYMYPSRSIIVSNNLAQSLVRHVKRIIRKKRN
jgi:hypothetical protein